MLMKLDVEKAFDRLEWSFIRQTLTQLNFPGPLIQLIMSCVFTSSISVLINGSLMEFYHPTIGLCQGDPLSPYLFVVSTEMLSRSINTTVDFQLWLPIQLFKNGQSISHLFFGDDIILTSKITTKSCLTIVDTLNYFTTLSGQSINFAKSKIVFSKNCDSNDKQFVLYNFNMIEGHRFEKYMGFPIFTHRPTKTDFQFLLDTFKTRLAGWKSKHLTMGGRTTLIRSTLNTLPNYIMQYISVPKIILSHLNRY